MKAVDLTGKRFGLLTAVERAESDSSGSAMWKCLCECGNYTLVRAGNLQSGAVKSCGCLRHRPTRTHNMSGSRLYAVWASMKARCCYKGHHSYADYGGRGIKMCKEWAESFQAFSEWALTHGYSDDLTIERIDHDGDYIPENCTFIPKSEQAKNRRSCVIIEHLGKKQNLMAWSKELGIPYSVLHNRMYKLGWSFERAISEPVHIEKQNRKGENNS